MAKLYKTKMAARGAKDRQGGRNKIHKVKGGWKLSRKKRT